MATVDITKALTGTTHQTKHGNVVLPYRTEVVLDIAEVVAKKGSALAAGDIVQAFRIPAKSGVLWAGATVMTKAAGGFTAGTVDIGVTGVDPDAFVDDFNIFTANVGDMAVQPAAYQPIVLQNEGTLDVLFPTLTGALTTGKFAIWAVLLDLAPIGRPGLVQVGS